MATLTAIVTPDGLALAPETMEQLSWHVGEEVTVTVTPNTIRPLPADTEQLIHETMGMLRDLPGMAEQLQRERREEDALMDSKW